MTRGYLNESDQLAAEQELERSRLEEDDLQIGRRSYTYMTCGQKSSFALSLQVTFIISLMD